MLIICLRTDKPEAELHLYDNDQLLGHLTWQAHRQLAETIHLKIRDLLTEYQKQLSDIGGVIVYAGPGSFTGLRIGISVANALAYGLGQGIVGTTGEGWRLLGVHRLLNGETDKQVLPEYGAAPHITPPKK